MGQMMEGKCWHSRQSPTQSLVEDGHESTAQRYPSLSGEQPPLSLRHGEPPSAPVPFQPFRELRQTERATLLREFRIRLSKDRQTCARLLTPLKEGRLVTRSKALQLLHSPSFQIEVGVKMPG